MNFCRLCVTPGQDLMEIFSDEGKALKIATIISKHFWFQVQENDSQSNRLCKDCWINTSNFHIFYCDVEKKQESYFMLMQPIKFQENEYFMCDGPLSESEETKPYIGVQELKEESPESLDELPIFNDSDDMESEKDIKAEKPHPVRRSKRKLKVESEQESKLPAKTSTTKDPKVKELEEKWRTSYKNGNASESTIREHCAMECVKCADGVQFTKWLEMKKHYRDEHQIPGYIMCCDKKFSKRIKILEHIARHINPEAFRCHFCNKNYSEKSSLEHHMLQHKIDKPFKCEKCPKSFAKVYQLASHQIRHIPDEEKKYGCIECGKVFASQSILNTHTRVVHENAYMHVCEICAKVFKSKMFFEKHKLDVHSNIKTPKVQCQLCGAWLKHERSLKKHMERHEAEKNTYVCTICGKKAPNKEALQSHSRYVHQTERAHKCSVCDKAFKKPLNLKEHMTLHTGETLYSCPYCPKTFNSNANMHAHKKKVHKQQWEEQQKLKAM